MSDRTVVVTDDRPAEPLAERLAALRPLAEVVLHVYASEPGREGACVRLAREVLALAAGPAGVAEGEALVPRGTTAPEGGGR